MRAPRSRSATEHRAPRRSEALLRVHPSMNLDRTSRDGPGATGRTAPFGVEGDYPGGRRPSHMRRHHGPRAKIMCSECVQRLLSLPTYAARDSPATEGIHAQNAPEPPGTSPTATPHSTLNPEGSGPYRSVPADRPARGSGGLVLLTSQAGVGSGAASTPGHAWLRAHWTRARKGPSRPRLTDDRQPPRRIVTVMTRSS